MINLINIVNRNFQTLLYFSTTDTSAADETHDKELEYIRKIEPTEWYIQILTSVPHDNFYINCSRISLLGVNRDS
jgi:hypothetical protein